MAATKPKLRSVEKTPVEPRPFFKKVLRSYRGLKGKFFLALAVTVLGVISATFLVLDFYLRRQVFETLKAEVNHAAQLFAELQQRDCLQLLEKSQVLASAPQLKAALDESDRLSLQNELKQFFYQGTPAHLSRQLTPLDSSHQVSDLCLVYDRQERLLTMMHRAVENGHMVIDSAAAFNLPDSLLASTWNGRERFVVWRNQHQAWWGALVPVWAGGSPLGPSVIGALALGMRLDDSFARHMQELVGAEVAVQFAEAVMAASIVEPQRQQFVAAIAAEAEGLSTSRPRELATKEEKFLSISLPLFESEPAVRVILFRSIDRSIAQLLRPVQRPLFIVGLCAFLAALVISLIIARHIAQPIAKLVDAAHAAGAGRLDQPIRIASHDEIGYLARRFEAMRQSLKHQMEKLTELNASLVERNADLENALAQLRRAQEDLVKSEKLAAAGKLTAQLSHEINNPIHNIRSCLETALKKMPPELAGRPFVQLAHDEILRIGKLVRQMLDFYRFGQIELQAVNLNTALVEVLETSQRHFEEHRIGLERHLAADLPAVRASRDQMKQVFLNLILNAIEAMPNGGKLETRSRRENGWAQIEIRDTGCGIPPENLPKIFDTFFTTKRAVHGVGLGLFVCYNIVHQYGGTIEARSELGKGSTFTVKLPLEKNVD
jgi:signal transduction histidine kinase